MPIQLLVKLYYALAFPHIQSYIVIWGAAPASHLKILTVRINNLLRVIQGVATVNGRPTVSTDDLYKQLGLLKLTSVFRYNLFKFLKLLIDGKLPEFWNDLMSEYIAPHSYNTRQLRFRHPALVCEIERRALSHQLIILYERVPRNILEMNFKPSLKAFKRSLMQSQ